MCVCGLVVVPLLSVTLSRMPLQLYDLPFDMLETSQLSEIQYMVGERARDSKHEFVDEILNECGGL